MILSPKTINATTRNDEMKNKTLRIATMLTLALLVPFLLIACGDADEGLTRADVSEIVRTEIANVPAPEPGLTARRSNRSCERPRTTSRKLSRNPPARRPSRWQVARWPSRLAGRRPPNTLSTLSRTPSASTSRKGSTQPSPTTTPKRASTASGISSFSTRTT